MRPITELGESLAGGRLLCCPRPPSLGRGRTRPYVLSHNHCLAALYGLLGDHSAQSEHSQAIGLASRPCEQGGAMEKDFFEGVENAACLYYDWAMTAADFCAPMAAVQEVLPSDKLKPIQVGPGVAKVSVMTMAYRRTSWLAPYNELGVMLPVLYEGGEQESALPGLYVLHLPVTTQQARDPGIKYYGFPKFVAQIDFDQVGSVRRCNARAAGQSIITLEVPQLDSVPQSWDLYFFTVKDSQLLRSRMQVQGPVGMSTLRGAARLALGDHPVAGEVRALDIDAISIGHQYAPQLQSILYFPGERLSL